MSLFLDPSHSDIEFSVRHMGLSTVRGRFQTFTVNADLADNGQPNGVVVEIETASIDTANGDRDNHLRSADFFDAEKYPTIRFEMGEVKGSGGDYTVSGTLDMHGVKKPVSFKAEVSGKATDPWGKQRIAIEGSGKLDRTDWDLSWNQVLEAGSLLVGKEIKFQFAIQLIVGE